MNCLLVALLLSQPSPPGGGYGIFTPAGPHNLAGQCLYFHQADDSDTYLCRSAANEVTQTCGGVAIFVCNASGCDLAGELGSVSSLDATTESTIETAIDTLNNVASIGSTTESTIEAAIDTLANLTSVQGQSISLSGGLTVEGATTTNQDLTTDANSQFNQVTVGNTGLVVGASTPFSDSSGTLTFQNIDALDATTETTIESAIDTLGDIAVGSVSQGDDKSVCQGADTDWCCEWDTDGTEGLLCAATDCDGIGTDCDPLHLYQDSGNLIADLKGIDSITNSSQKITIGPPGASSHSTGANQCHFTCTQEEHDGAVYFDGTLNVGDIVTGTNKVLVFGGYAGGLLYPNQTADQFVWALRSNTGNQLLFVPYSYWSKDWGLASQSPIAIGITSNEDPDTDATQISKWQWNRLALGGDGGGLGCINQTFAYTDFTDDGGASGHLDLDEQIPIGSDFPKMILHSITGFTGDTTAALTVGDSGGVDPDRYHSAGTLNVVASSAAGIACGEPSGTTKHSAAVTVRLVLTGAADFGNFSAGEATISICYWTP